MIRIGILGHGFIEWGGGIDFLRGVVSSLHHTNQAVELHVLVPTRGPRLTATRLLRHTYRAAKAVIGRAGVVVPHPNALQLTDLANSAEQRTCVHEIDIGSYAIANAASRLSLDVLLPAFAPLPADFATPWIGYVYDFQHRYLPQLFAPGDCRHRDRHFAEMLKNASTVIVNARTVAADVARFHPEARARVFALPFNAAPQTSWLMPSESPLPKYGIENPYFIVCNQFWKHKDHATAFAAFAKIAATHTDVDLVCTGTTSDYRDPQHVPALQNFLAREGIANRVHILGNVPKTDQIALLKRAIALIQPTLFEGGPGGGAVYDAISLGVHCVVSDIDVNRELVESGISFFQAGSVSALAALLSALVDYPSVLDRSAELLFQQGQARREACGAQILTAIEYARAQP